MTHTPISMLFGCIIAAVLTECAVAETLCPYCVCLPSYSPVCGRQSDTGMLKGFISRCVLECSNKCRKNKFLYVSNGRCGKTTTTSTTTTTTTSTTTTTPVSTLAAETTFSSTTASADVTIPYESRDVSDSSNKYPDYNVLPTDIIEPMMN